MVAAIIELYRARELLYTWTQREFKVRYSQSFLGVAWAILQPFSLMIIFSVVFSVVIKVPTGNVPYPIFAYTALLPWTFFSNSLSFAIPSLVNNINLVGKIYFPREILPLASILVCLVDFVIASSIYVLMMVYYHVPVGVTALIVPVVIVVQLILTVGISFLLAAMNVFYRDIRFIIPLMLQIWMYISPIIYPVDMVPQRFVMLYFLNPMAVLIDTYRRVLLQNQMPNWPFFILAIVISVAFSIFAYAMFKKAEKNFADLI